MIFNAKLFKNILGIAGVVALVLIVGVFLKSENKKISVSSAEIQGASDEVIIDHDLEASDYRENTDDGKPKNTEQKSSFYKVVKVIDGDTIVADIGGKNETIRLIGIDAPEIGGGSQSKKCFGKEAEEFAKKILNGANVYLEKDESQNDRDKYSRLLRYVLTDGRNNFNEQMISDGLAREYTYKIPYKYQKEFKNAENKARSGKKGLWDACYNDNGGDENRNVGNLSSGAPSSGTGDCYCKSNKYNCTDFKTHLEAQKIFECCMAKVGKDVHKLDRNNDGHVCKSLP